MSTPPVGSLFIPSDAFDSVRGDSVVISGTDGTLISSTTFVTADQGGRLASGIFALAAQVSSSNGHVNAVNVYNLDLSLIGSVSIANWFSPAFCASKQYFYIQNPSSPFTVEQIDSSGAATGKTWALSTNAGAIAVTDDDSVLYWIDGLTIKAFDLVNNVALPDVLVLPLGTQLQGLIIVVNSTDFIITYTNSSISPDWQAERFNGSGVSQKVYGPVTNAGDYDAPEVFIDRDPTVFWMRAFDSDTDLTSTWNQFDLTSGSIVITFTTTDMDGGGTVPTTCPVVSMGAVSSTTGTLVVGKASNPLASGIDFTINVSGQAPFVLQTDTAGETLTLPAGIYSVTESAQANYQPTYFVSNDTTNNNLAVVITADQLVDVVVVNTLSATFGGLYQLVPGKTNDTLRNQDGSTTNKMISWFWELFTNRDK